jgi:hypothetical protein
LLLSVQRAEKDNSVQARERCARLLPLFSKPEKV